MTFTVKNWQDAPSTATPLSAVALEDLETRLSTYSDSAGGGALLGVDPTLAPYSADKTGGVDCTAALRSARAAALAANMPVILPPGTYTVSGRVHDAAVTSNPVKFVAASPGTVTIQRSANNPIIDVSGSRGTSVALSANVTSGATSVTVASLPAGVAVNDHVEIESDTIFSGVGNLAEIRRVQAITGSGPYTIEFYGRLEENYLTAANARVRKLTLAGPSTVTGITFRQTAMDRDTANNSLVQFELTQGDRVDQCTLRDADCPGVEFQSCIDWTVESCHFENLTDDPPNTRLGYGINCGDNCLNGHAWNCTATKVRHAFTSNGNSVTPHGVPRHITVHFRGVRNCTNSGLDTHPEGKHITFVHPHVYDSGAGSDDTGISVRAPYTTILHPTVAGAGSSGGCVLFAAGAVHSRVIGGDLVQLGVAPVIVIDAQYTTVSGTKIMCLSGGNVSPIQVNTNDSKLLNIESDLGSSTGYHVLYTGSNRVRGVLSGGIFTADVDRPVINISTGSTLTILEMPHRYPNGLAQMFVTGAGIAGITFPERNMTTVASDSDVTLYPYISQQSIRHTGTLTADRAVTLDTTSATKGWRFRISRTGGGAFKLNVGTGPLRSLPTGGWCEVEYDGAAWFLAEHGDDKQVASPPGSYAMTAGDQIVEVVTGSPRTITLPSIASVPIGDVRTIKDLSGFAGSASSYITVTRAGSDVFEDGTTSKLIATNFGKLSVYRGPTSKWMIVDADARVGIATLTAGTVVVSTTAVTATSRIQLTSNVDGGTPGFLRVSARTAGTSFTITSSSGTDTSQVAWLLSEP